MDGSKSKSSKEKRKAKDNNSDPALSSKENDDASIKIPPKPVEVVKKRKIGNKKREREEKEVSDVELSQVFWVIVSKK